MKKENANNRLTFSKVSVTELNNSSLQSIKGGVREPVTTSSGVCSGCFCPVITKTVIIAES